MLPKVNRLTKRKDIEKVFKQGRFFKEDFLILKIIENDLGKVRFSFSVSQRVSKKAASRNKIKRRLSGIVGAKLKKIKKGIDTILIACPGLEEKDFWEMEEIVTKLFKRAKII